MDEAALIGEPLALDLVNTRPLDADLLNTPADLANWLARQADRFASDGRRAADLAVGRLTRADLGAVHDVREHITAVLGALIRDERPATSALRALDAAQAAAPAIRRLDWGGDRLTVTTHREGSAGARLAAVFAEAATELVTDPAIGKLKHCEADDCVLLFLPAHPRRRWCSPDRCGNRVRVARYYHRHKTAD